MPSITNCTCKSYQIGLDCVIRSTQLVFSFCSEYFCPFMLNRGVISKRKRRQWVWWNGTIHLRGDPCDNDLFDEFLVDLEPSVTVAQQPQLNRKFKTILRNMCPAQSRFNTPYFANKTGLSYLVKTTCFVKVAARYTLPSNLWYKAYQILKLKCFSPRLADVFVQSIEARCWVENEDVVGAAPAGDDAPTASEWSTMLLPTKARFILEIWRYILRYHWLMFTVTAYVCRHRTSKIGLGNGLLPDGTKLLPELMRTDHHWGPAVTINRGQFPTRHLSYKLQK